MSNVSRLIVLLTLSVTSCARAHVVGALTREQLTEKVETLNKNMDIVMEKVTAIESALGLPVTKCPDGWIKFQSSCYGVGSEALSWGEAQEMCGQFGGGLAEVNNSAENNFIKDISRSRGYKGTWLGATDIFSDGHWVWTTSGRPLSEGFTDWYPGEPANSGRSQDCLTNWKDHPDYRWGDLQCEYKMNFVCEIQLA